MKSRFRNVEDFYFIDTNIKYKSINIKYTLQKILRLLPKALHRSHHVTIKKFLVENLEQEKNQFKIGNS